MCFATTNENSKNSAKIQFSIFFIFMEEFSYGHQGCIVKLLQIQ